MSHPSSFHRTEGLPVGPTLSVLAAAIAISGGALVWAVAETPMPQRGLMAAYGGTVSVVLCVAVTVAAYAVQKARQSRGRVMALSGQIQRMEVEAEELGEVMAPTVVRRLREGAPVDNALGEVSHQVGPVHLRVLQTLALAVEEDIGSARRAGDRIGAMEAEAIELAEVLAPTVVRRLREGASVDTALGEVSLPAGEVHLRVLRTLAHEVGRSERTRAATMLACANGVGRVQALVTSMLAQLREMEDRHGEEVLGDLLKLDHSTAQTGRLADNIAVLTGARSGRRWTKPIVMESILRGAAGRISEYKRIQTHSASTTGVAGYAAEGIMHALAELMDNAASFSPPTESVHVYVEEVHSGVVVTIEDSGLGMSPTSLERAKKTVSTEPADLATLSGTRLGLSVVGLLARKYGLTISFRPSARGGTGVVVMIPARLIAQPEPDSAPVEPSPPAAGGPPTASAHGLGGTTVATASTSAAHAAPASPAASIPAAHAAPASTAPSTFASHATPSAPHATPPAPHATSPAPHAAAPPPAPGLGGEQEDGAPGEPDELDALPKRLPGQTLREAETKTGDASRPASARPPASEAGDRFKAFHQVFRQTGPGAGGGSSVPPEASSPEDGGG